MSEYVANFEAYSARSEADPASGPPPYLRTWNFYDDVPALLHDFPADSPYFRDYFKTLKEMWQPPFTWLFLGPRGAQTRLHVDVWHTDAWWGSPRHRMRMTFDSIHEDLNVSYNASSVFHLSLARG